MERDNGGRFSQLFSVVFVVNRKSPVLAVLDLYTASLMGRELGGCNLNIFISGSFGFWAGGYFAETCLVVLMVCSHESIPEVEIQAVVTANVFVVHGMGGGSV